MGEEATCPPPSCSSWASSSTAVLILGITAGSVGLTLTRSCNAVFVELYWVPATMMQAEARIHRMGQERLANVHYCVHPAKESLDRAIFAVLNRKAAGEKELMDGLFHENFNVEAISKFVVRGGGEDPGEDKPRADSKFSKQLPACPGSLCSSNSSAN